MKRKLLILGVNSYLGSNFYKYQIKKKDFITFGTINKNNYRLNNNNINIYKIDLKNSKSKLINLLQKVEPNLIINFTGNSNRYELNKNKLKINIIKNILNCLKKSQISIDHFYNIGSSEEYYGSKFELSENNKLLSFSNYGRYKINTHKYLLNFSLKNNFNYTNLRTFNILGNDKHKKNIISYLASSIGSKKNILKNKYSIRDYMWINDYLIILNLILNNNRKNYQAINIGTGHGSSIESIINYIEKKKKLKFNSIVFEKGAETKIEDTKIANTDRLKKITGFDKYLSINKIIDKML